jgi:hypothetical protein
MAEGNFKAYFGGQFIGHCTAPAFVGVPVQFCEYVDGVKYFKPMNTIIAKNEAVFEMFLEWANEHYAPFMQKQNALGDSCVAELEALFAAWNSRKPLHSTSP